MQVELTSDDELVEKAISMTGITDLTDLLNGALRSLIQREAARRLAALGGTMPGLKHIPRRRPKA